MTRESRGHLSVKVAGTLRVPFAKRTAQNSTQLNSQADWGSDISEMMGIGEDRTYRNDGGPS
jgi:hypothetical protein